MAQSITEGLFPSVAGLFSPVGSEQTRQLEMAGRPVDPLQAVSGDIGFLGTRMRQGIGGAFGQMPEQDRKRQLAQQAAQELQQQGVDVSTPQGLLALAQRLDSLPGFSGESLAIRQAAAQMAQQQRMGGLEEQLKIAQTEKARAEAEKAGREKEPYVKTSEKFARVGQDILGIPAKANLQEYSQEETALINKELEKMAIKEAESSAAKLSFEGQKKVLGIDEKDAEDYRMQRNASIKQLKALNNMERLLGQGVITGSLQEARTGFLRALDTLGVSTDKARNVISNTEQFDKEVRQLLLGIIKTLGYNPSNADVRFAMDSLPNLTSSASGLQEIVKRFIKANSDTLQESERALTHYRKNNGSFEGFTPNIDIYAPKQITVKDLSDEELQKRLAAARASAKQAK